MPTPRKPKAPIQPPTHSGAKPPDAPPATSPVTPAGDSETCAQEPDSHAPTRASNSLSSIELDKVEKEQEWAERMNRMRPWKQKVINALLETPILSVGAKAGRVGIATLMEHRAKDPEFDALCREAIGQGVGDIETVLFKVAKMGDVRAVEIFLKAKMPEEYKEKPAAPPSAMPLLDAALAKCLESGSLAAFAAKLAARRGRTIEAQTITVGIEQGK